MIKISLQNIFIGYIIIFVSVIKKEYGALAQLGERFAGSEEVSGSNPLCSTTKNPRYNRVSFNF
jgi:hypothetical protein